MIESSPVVACHDTSRSALLEVARCEDGTAAVLGLALTSRTGRTRRVRVRLDRAGRLGLISALGGVASHKDLAAIDAEAGRPPWVPADPPHDLDQACADPDCPICPHVSPEVDR